MQVEAQGRADSLHLGEEGSRRGSFSGGRFQPPPTCTWAPGRMGCKLCMLRSMRSASAWVTPDVHLRDAVGRDHIGCGAALDHAHADRRALFSIPQGVEGGNVTSQFLDGVDAFVIIYPGMGGAPICSTTKVPAPLRAVFSAPFTSGGSMTST